MQGVPRARLATAVIVCATLCAAAAGTARASTRLLPALSAISARPQLHMASGITPAAGVATVEPASVQLATYGVPIRRGNTTNWLYLDTYMFQGDTSASLDAFLGRGTNSHNQFHDYWWLRPATLTYNPRTMAARMNAGAISPSSIAMRFAPTHVYSHTCTLVGGGTGTYHRAIGRLRISSFRLVTNTSPVFGTIATPPRKAELLVDPGCRSSVVGFNAHPCPAAEAIDAPGLARSEWIASTNAAGTRALIWSLSPSTTLTKEQHSHLTEDRVPATDLPPPTLSATGATATILTSGSVFSRGEGIFTSARAPRLVTGSCTRSGVHHTYAASVYRGVLSPGITPLVALFDTGHIGLAPNTAAYLEVSHLTS
jgi:hypothetical protein